MPHRRQFDAPPSRRTWPWPVALVAVFVPWFWWTRAGWQSGDALAYLVAARSGQDLFHPHHLLYSPAVRGVHLLLGVDVLQAAQLHGVLFAVAGVVLVFLTTVSLTQDRRLAAIVACGLAVTEGYWLLATQANPYVPALACLIGVSWLAARSQPRLPSTAELVGIAALWALAILYHQLHVLFIVPLVAYLVWIRGCSPARVIRLVLAPAAVLVAGAYVLAFLASAAQPGWTAWLEFTLRYARYPNPTWGSWNNLGPAGLMTLLVNQLWNLIAVPPARTTLPALALAVLAGLVIVWNVRGAVFRDGVACGFRGLLLVWTATYLGFCGWWLPAHKPLFLNTVPALLWLGLLPLLDVAESRRTLARALRPGLVALVLGVGLYHLAVVVWPAHTATHPARDEARELDTRVPAGVQLLTSYEVAQSLRYYHGRMAAAHARYPLLCLYDGREIPADAQLRDDLPLLIDLGYLRPDLDVFGSDGFRDPAAWRAYLDWVVGVEADAGGEPVACREFDVIRTASGRAYLRLSAGRRPVADLGSLCRELDRAAGGGDAVFARWYAAAGNAP